MVAVELLVKVLVGGTGVLVLVAVKLGVELGVELLVGL